LQFQNKSIALNAMGLAVVFLLFMGIFHGHSKHARTHAMTTKPAPFGKLLSVQAVFRHGARTPLSTIYWPDFNFQCDDSYPGARIDLVDETGNPNPPALIDLNMPKWGQGGCRMGQLTREGYHMALNLGEWMRKTYVDDYGYLAPTFQEGEVSVRTTCIQRAMQTLQGVVTGLWPDLVRGSLRANASRENTEFMYGKNSTCPTIGPLYSTLTSKIAARDVGNQSLAKLAGEVAAGLGLQGGGPQVNWLRLHDSLACMGAEPNTTMPLPPSATSHLIKQVFRQAVAHEAPVLGPLPRDGLLPAEQCAAVIRRSVGPLMWRLVTNMRMALDGAGQSGASSRARVRPVTGGLKEVAGTQSSSAAGSVGSQKQTKPGPDAARGVDADEAERKLLACKSGMCRKLLHHQAGGVSCGDHAHGFMQRALMADGKQVATRQQRREAKEEGQAAGTTGGDSTDEALGKRRGVQLDAPPKAFLYSGHDSTITPLLAAMGRPETEWPPFTASLVFELWGAHTQGGMRMPLRGAGSTYLRVPVVRVLYNRVPLDLPGPGTFKGGFITLDELAKRWAPYSADDAAHAKECWG